jgi:hypothetical protein
MLLLLVTSSDVEPCPLALVPRRRSPSSLAAHRLGPVAESHDPDARPLPVGAVKWANRRSSRLLHRILRSSGVPESKGPASLEGSAGGGGAVRDGVGEVGDVVAVRSASGPWGWPRGSMEIRVIRRVAGAPTRPVTTVMRRASSSSSYPSSSP